VTDKTETTILLDIYERLGAIEAKLQAGADHEKRIAKLERFEGRVGAYIWVGGGLVAGALSLLLEGIKYGIDHLVRH
jgi:hypothetical protein